MLYTHIHMGRKRKLLVMKLVFAISINYKQTYGELFFFCFFFRCCCFIWFFFSLHNVWCMGNISVCTILSTHYIYYMTWRWWYTAKMIFDWYKWVLIYKVQSVCYPKIQKKKKKRKKKSSICIGEYVSDEIKALCLFNEKE